MVNMRPLFGLILISAIFLSFVSTEEQMKDFCEAFKENNYTISYGFRRLTKANEYSQYLFIDQYYWQLFYEDSKYSSLTKATLDLKNGQKSNWFGNKYSMAVCVWIPGDNKCRTVLIQPKNRVIECGDLEPFQENLDLVGKSNNKTVEIKTSYKLGFVPVWQQAYKQYVTLVQFDSRVEYKTKRFKSDCSLVDVDDKDLGDQDLKPIIFDKLDKSLKLVAVLGQNMSSAHPTFKGEEWRGMILIFEVDRVLKYCISYIAWTDRCSPGGLKTLIDCTSISAKTPVDPNDEDNTKGLRSFWIWIWIALIAIVVLSVLIMSLVWYKRNRSEEPTANPSALSTINTQTGQSTTQTTSKAQSGKSTVQSGKKKTRSPSRSSKTRSPSQSQKTQSPSRSPKTQIPSQSQKTQSPSRSPKTQIPSQSQKTQSPSRSPKSKSPSRKTLTPTRISTGH